MLYFPPPSASGNITSRGFPGTSGQTFWYISLKAMKYLYNNQMIDFRADDKGKKSGQTIWEAPPHKNCLIKVMWLLVGYIENLRRFSGISAISRLEAGDIKVMWRNNGIINAFQNIQSGKTQINLRLRAVGITTYDLMGQANSRKYLVMSETCQFETFI